MLVMIRGKTREKRNIILRRHCKTSVVWMTTALLLLSCRSTNAPPLGNINSGDMVDTVASQSDTETQPTGAEAPPGTVSTETAEAETVAPPETEDIPAAESETVTQPIVPPKETEAITPPPTQPEVQTEAVTEAKPPPVIPDVTESTGAIAAGELVCRDFALYAGQYVEDGSDETVEGVIALLLENRSGKYLELATVSVDVDGKTAVFQATGMPSGTSAWVMEATRMKPATADSITVGECKTAYRASVDTPDAVAGQLTFAHDAENGTLTAKNIGDKTAYGVFVCYKTKHTDGAYLGGITYRVDFGEIAPGQTATVIAGHYTESASEIVRVGQSAA